MRVGIAILHNPIRLPILPSCVHFLSIEHAHHNALSRLFLFLLLVKTSLKSLHRIVVNSNMTQLTNDSPITNCFNHHPSVFPPREVWKGRDAKERTIFR